MARDLGTLPTATQAPTGGRVLGDISQAPTAVSPQPSFADSIWQQIVGQAKSGASQASEGLGDFQNSDKNPIENGLKTASGLATAVSAPFAPIAKPIAAATQFAGDKLESTFGPAVERGLADTQGPTAAERTLTDVSQGLNIMGTVAGFKSAPDVADTVRKTYEGLATTAQDALKPSQASLDKGILDNYTRAIKPTVVGKSTEAGYKAYSNNVVSAIKTIASNKDNLKFTTDLGEETGRLPQTPRELSQALDQTKQSIFKQYDALAKQAGDKGAKVDSKPAADALDSVINNEALKVTNPAAVKYATEIKERLLAEDKGVPAGMTLTDYLDSTGKAPEFKQFDTNVAQDIIKNYNDSLEAFYKNPSYDNASKAAIDAGVVHKFRESLDSAITNAKGEGYQALKKQYGSLKAIEKDVTKRSIVLARQAGIGPTGLGKYVDIFSGGDMATGLMTLNPALFAKGVAQTGISHFFQYLNSPDRAISNMFKSAEGNTLGAKVSNAIETKPSMGLSTKAVGPDPLSVAKKIGGADIPAIQDFVNEPSANNFMKLQSIMEAEPGLNDLSLENIQRFFKDVIQERNSPDFKPAKVGGATPIQDKASGKMQGSKSVDSPKKSND